MRAESTIAILLIVLLSVPLLYYLFVFGARARIETPRAIKGDDAITEIYVINATRGEQLLGPYSRFRWNNPGPSYYYAVAPVYMLLGRKSSAVKAGAVLINLFSLAALMLIAWRNLGFLRFCVMSPFVAIFLLYLGGKIKSTWNPYATILPFALLLFVSAAVATRKRWALPAQALLASFVVQTHIMYLPVAVVITSAALILRWLDSGKEETRDHQKWWPYWVAASMVLVVMWTPALIEELIYPDGNLSKILSFFIKENEVLGLIPSLFAVSEHAEGPIAVVLNSFTPFLGENIFQVAMVFILLLLLGLGFWAWLLESKNKQRFSAALLLLAVVGILASIAAVSRVVGEMHEHLVLWTSALGIILLTSISAAFISPLIERVRKIDPVVTTGLIAISLTVLISAVTTMNIRQGIKNADRVPTLIKTAADPLLKHMKNGKAGEFLVRPANEEVWPLAAGLVLHLHRNGLEFAVDEDWLFMFGRRFSPTGKETKEILLTDIKTFRKLSGLPGHTAIITQGQIRAFETPIDH